MNKTAIKNYAIWARNELIERVTRKAFEYEVKKDIKPDENMDVINGKVLTEDERKQRKGLIKAVEDKGFDQVIEEVAYTWFNRFIALRFMEVNNYLPKRVRIFTNENNEFKPQILDEAMNIELEGLSKEEIYNLLQSNNRQELYKQLLIATCNDMGNYLPGMFTNINDYKVLLFPDNLLNQDSVVGKLISDIDEDSWSDQVQIIGWLYQYYNTELKDQVIGRPKGQKVNKHEIPYATELFTPDWIVRYMVENSLGRFWVEGHPDGNLKESWRYYLDEAKQDDEVVKQLEEIQKDYAKYNPEEIKLVDPSMGSGHILIYAFEIFMQIYEKHGYTQRDAAILILEKNLYGMDIDKRAYQLAYFSLMMQARKYNRRILALNIRPNLLYFTNSKKIEDNNLNKLGELKELGNRLIQDFKYAEEYGSIFKANYSLDDLNKLNIKLEELENKKDDSDLMDILDIDYLIETISPLINQARLLSQKYQIVVTNPPYFAVNGCNDIVQNYVKEKYPDSKTDLFAVFMEMGQQLTMNNGFCCMVTMQSWMFLSSFEKFRKKLLSKKTICTLMHMENMVMKIAFGTAVTNIRNGRIIDYKGTYNQIKLSDIEDEKPKNFPNYKNRFAQISADNFSKIPGNPIAYWLSSKLISAFQVGRPLSPVAKPCAGLQTGDNGRFLRLWFEVCNHNVSFNTVSTEDSMREEARWFPYNKGGEFRKWYGNNDYVVNWENDGYEIKHFYGDNGKLRSRPQNTQYYFKECASWSLVSSSATAFRYKPSGFIFDVAGMSFFANKNLFYYLGFCNTKIAYDMLKIIAPTINFQAGDIAKLPIVFEPNKVNYIEGLVKDNINISKKDWDSFEISWDFTAHPLLKNKVNTISEAYSLWYTECNERFNQLKANEEELNRIFIDIYGLQDELDPYVEDKNVTVRKDDLVRDIKSFISYAVGCMFGRYSLDVEGLAYAGGEWDDSKYTSFIPDKDNIIPICDDEYFDDDIVGRFVKFVEIVYGKDTLEENLSFIADALGGKGTSREVIRNYFLNEFYKDHCKIYQKRPIYWLFDSGKKNGFKALIYLHRYQPDLIARMRTQYVFEQQSRYKNQIEMIENQMNGDISSSERVRLNKKLKTLRNQDEELRKYEEVVRHYADQMIRIDLDDGVKVNYSKFKDLLAKIK